MPGTEQVPQGSTECCNLRAAWSGGGGPRARLQGLEVHKAPSLYRHENQDTRSSWGLLEGEQLAPLPLCGARRWAASGLSDTTGGSAWHFKSQHTPPSFHVFPGENWIFPPGGSTNFEPLQGLCLANNVQMPSPLGCGRSSPRAPEPFEGGWAAGRGEDRATLGTCPQ